jgi:hypothetical protein
MQDINSSIEVFGDKTFAEIVLDLRDEEGNRVFSHFNRAWSTDPSKKKWSLSVRSNLLTSTRAILDNIQDTLCTIYRNEVNQFFETNHTSDGWAEVVGRYKQQEQEDEDNWFEDDDDIDDMVKTGLVDSSFIPFLSEQVDDDRKSVASWGTGDTAYTEIVTTQETSDTATSSISSGGTPIFIYRRARKEERHCSSTFTHAWTFRKRG